MYTRDYSRIPSRDFSKEINKYQFLFINLTKREWIETQLSNSDSAFFEVIREEVEEFFYKIIGKNQSILHFDDMYNISKNVTIRQIQKSIRKNKRCFFECRINIEDTSMYYMRLKSRLVNNLRNLLQTSRKINVTNVLYWIISDIYTNYEEEFIVIDIEKLSKIEPDKLITAINLLLNNYEIDVDELIEVCEKYNIKKSNFSSIYFSFEFKSLRKMVDNQIIIDFDEVA